MRRSGTGQRAVLALAGIVVVLGGGAVFVGLCQRRGEDARVRSEALPRCVARLGDEPECRRRIEAGHEDCAVYARHFPGRFTGGRSFLDPEIYLECIVLSPSGWVDKKGREREAQKAERDEGLSGH